MDILLCTDKKYIMPTCVAIKSISSNNNHVHFHVLVDKDVLEFHKAKILKMIDCERGQKISFYVLNKEALNNFPLGKEKSYITLATYYRLFLTDFLPNNISKIIYLDGDVINTEALDELWNTNLGNIPIGAVTDLAEEMQDFNRLGYEKEKGYFNAGVLLINVEYWRKHNLKDIFINFIIQNKDKIKQHDQDILNMIFYDNKLELPMKYNVQNGFLVKKEYTPFKNNYKKYESSLLESIAHPVLIHYTDFKKPWFIEDCNPFGYYFFKYYKQTEWSCVPLKPCNKSKLRYWGSKILRSLNCIPPAKTEKECYYSLFEINRIKNEYEQKNTLD